MSWHIATLSSPTFPLLLLCFISCDLSLIDVLLIHSAVLVPGIQQSDSLRLCCAVLCLVAHSRPSLCDPVDCSPPGSSIHSGSPGKNTGVETLEYWSHALLQGIFPSQGSNPGLLHCRWILYCLSDSLKHTYVSIFCCSDSFPL